MLKDAIKLVNKYMSLDGDDQEAFDSLRKDRMRLAAAQVAESAPKRRRKKRKAALVTDMPEASPEIPEPKVSPLKRRGKKAGRAKQMTVDEAVARADAGDDPLATALKGVL